MFLDDTSLDLRSTQNL